MVPRDFISYLCTYDLYGLVRNAFVAGSIHYEGKWEVVGLWKSRLFWALWLPLGAQKSRNTGPNLLPLDQVMDAARIKSIMHRAI